MVSDPLVVPSSASFQGITIILASPLALLLLFPAARWGLAQWPPAHGQCLCLNSRVLQVLHYPLHSAPFDPHAFATLMPAQYKQGALIKASLFRPAEPLISAWVSNLLHNVPTSSWGL